MIFSPPLLTTVNFTNIEIAPQQIYSFICLFIAHEIMKNCTHKHANDVDVVHLTISYVIAIVGQLHERSNRLVEYTSKNTYIKCVHLKYHRYLCAQYVCVLASETVSSILSADRKKSKFMALTESSDETKIC